MRPPRLGTLFALAACLILVPATALALPKIGQKHDGYSVADEKALHVYVDCWHAFKARCGRNIVDDGLTNGKQPSDARIENWTATMERWLHPPEPPAVDSPVVVAEAPAPTSVAPTSDGSYAIPSYIVDCESGGNYSAVNPSSGAYGAYQILPSTWASYHCGDPSSPADQDACAADIYADSGTSQWSCG